MYAAGDVVAIFMSTTCFAAGTGTSAVTQPLENLKTLIIAVIGAVGVIILAKNVMEFAQAYRMSLELMLKIVTKYGVDPNTLFGIESREKHENKDLSVLEDKLQMLKPNDREYAMSTCLIFIEGLEARKEVV